jgi:predicted NBD/HSP70 family sugar kinase
VPAAAWKAVAKDVVVGLTNVTVLWSPDVIVLGGGVMQKGKIPFPLLRPQLQKHLKISAPLIRRAALGNAAGLWGGAAWN